MTLDQLMAFTVYGDHERQEQVFERLSLLQQAAACIRRMLTEGAVRAADKRAQFIGVEAYVEAGGTSCATCSRAMTVAGCRMWRWSIGWWPTS